MNYKLKHLYKEANIWTVDQMMNNTPETSLQKDNIKPYLDILYEKFAELIINECIGFCESNIMAKSVILEQGLNYNDGVMDCSIGLKHYFGIDIKNIC